jgi:hypothetical protein
MLAAVGTLVLVLIKTAGSAAVYAAEWGSRSQTHCRLLSGRLDYRATDNLVDAGQAVRKARVVGGQQRIDG